MNPTIQRLEKELAREQKALAKDTKGMKALRFVSAFVLLGLITQMTGKISNNRKLELDNTMLDWAKHSNSPELDRYFKTFTFVGKQPITITLSLGTFWLLLSRKQFYQAWLVLLAVVGGALINNGIKRVFTRSRPPSLNTLLHQSDSSSFPSGHSTLATCYYGALIWLGWKFFKRPLGKIGWSLLLLYLIFMIGLSRIYLKEHYASDVLGGYLTGSLWLLILVSTVDTLEQSGSNQ